MEITNGEILEAKVLKDQVSREYAETVKKVQANCSHKDVGEHEVPSSEWNNYQKQLCRVCLHCGKIEHARYVGSFGLLKNLLVYKLDSVQYESLKKVV